MIGGPTLAAGYLDDPVATAAAFVEHDDGREFRTGDLGRWVDGRLEVLGRVDDVIVTGGEKVAPAAVERVLAAQPGVRAACVVGLPDPEWGAVVAAALVVDAPPAADGLRAAVRAVLGRAAVPRVLRTVDALPLRGIGKPDRAAVARLLGRNRRPTRRGDPSPPAPVLLTLRTCTTPEGAMSFRAPTADPGSERRCGWHAAPRRPSPGRWWRRRPSSARRRRTRPRPGTVSWSPPLAGEAVGVTVSGRTVRLAAGLEQPGTARADGHGAVGTPGLLTLPARHMDVPVDRVDAVLTLAAGSPGAAASVDVRGLRARGGWTEWEPGVPTSGPAAARTLTAALPEPVVDVQARLVLTLPTDAGWAMPGPVVRDLTLTAHVATRTTAAAKRDPRRYRVFATREGLVGGTTANGHVIGERDLFVALPSRRALAPRDSSDYTVKVCAPTGRCAFAPVWDVGPWNTRDDYWNAEKREQWRDLPPGVPQAQAA